MTNPLIPYSFTPGSKAKAQEVNANFLSVAEGIDANKQFTVSEIETINNKIENDLKTSLAQKELGNSGKVANIIIEAPEGVAEYEGSTITIKKDLKVLIPNGRNTDGTFKNTEYTVEADKTLEFGNTPDGTYFFAIKTNGTSVYRLYKDIIESETQPTGMDRNITWYDTKNNYWYDYTHSTTSWVKIEMTPFLGSFSISDGIITTLKAFEPCKILDNSRKKEIMSWFAPDYSKSILVTFDELYTGYKPPIDGLMIFSALRPSSGDRGIYIYINDMNVGYAWMNGNDINGITSSYTVSSDDVIKISTTAYTYSYIYFIPAKGAH